MSTTSDSGFGLETDSLTTLHWIAVAIAIISGIVHLALGVPALPSGFGISFILAGIAFFVAVGLFLIDYRRRLLYLIGIPFTAIQIVLYFVLNWPDVIAPAGIGDKVLQTTLVVILYVLYRRES